MVFHSAVLGYVSRERREAFAKVLAETSRRREIFWISSESPGVVATLAAQAPAIPQLRFVVGRTRFADGAGRDELLALAHPHGLEMTWL